MTPQRIHNHRNVTQLHDDDNFQNDTYNDDDHEIENDGIATAVATISNQRNTTTIITSTTPSPMNRSNLNYHTATMTAISAVSNRTISIPDQPKQPGNDPDQIGDVIVLSLLSSSPQQQDWDEKSSNHDNHNNKIQRFVGYQPYHYHQNHHHHDLLFKETVQPQNPQTDHNPQPDLLLYKDTVRPQLSPSLLFQQHQQQRQPWENPITSARITPPSPNHHRQRQGPYLITTNHHPNLDKVDRFLGKLLDPTSNHDPIVISPGVQQVPFTTTAPPPGCSPKLRQINPHLFRRHYQHDNHDNHDNENTNTNHTMIHDEPYVLDTNNNDNNNDGNINNASTRRLLEARPVQDVIFATAEMVQQNDILLNEEEKVPEMEDEDMEDSLRKVQEQDETGEGEERTMRRDSAVRRISSFKETTLMHQNQHSCSWYQQWIMIFIVVGVLFITIVSIVMTTLLLNKKTNNPISTDNNNEPSPMAMVTMNPTAIKKGFDTREELDQTIRKFLSAQSSLFLSNHTSFSSSSSTSTLDNNVPTTNASLWTVNNTNSYDTANITMKEIYDTYGSIEYWDVSRITNFSSLFDRRQYHNLSNYLINVDLSQWDVSSVTTMRSMFYQAHNFTSDLSSWNVCNVVDMEELFYEAWLFDSNLSFWNTSQVVTMKSMFSDARSFRGDGLENWNVTNVQLMNHMFMKAKSFNANLYRWDVQNVQSVSEMFHKATSFVGMGIDHVRG
jgi:surface protein